MTAKKTGPLVPNVSRVSVPFPLPTRGMWFGTFLRYGAGKRSGEAEVAPDGGGPTRWVAVGDVREIGVKEAKKEQGT